MQGRSDPPTHLDCRTLTLFSATSSMILSLTERIGLALLSLEGIFSTALLLVPFYTVVKLDTGSSKTIQGTSDSEIHLSVAQPFHQLQIVEVSTSACVRNGNRAPLCKSADQTLVDALLKTLVVCRVDEKLGAVWFQTLDGFYLKLDGWHLNNLEHIPWLTSISVMVCHLFMATYQESSPRRRQLRSMTSLFLSPPSA